MQSDQGKRAHACDRARERACPAMLSNLRAPS